MSQGNFFAYFVLIAFPIFSAFLFRRLDHSKAIIWIILLGFLLLPVKTGIDLPVGPFLDKSSIPALTAFFLAYQYYRGRLNFLPESRLISFMIIAFVFFPMITAYFNQERLVYGEKVIEGMNYFSGEGISALALRTFYIVPFILGYQFFQSKTSLVNILTVISVAGLAYTLIVLWEVRMSPRLHSIFYGYFPHDFMQQVRNGGFRSVAFIGHGLRTSMFLVVCLIATLYFAKNKIKLFKIAPIFLVAYLILVILLNKSLAALIFALLGTLFVYFLPEKIQRASFLLLGVIVLAYPAIRGSDFFPDDYMIDLALGVDEARAQSLEFRFDNEERLLEKALMKPVVGWGPGARNRVYDERGEQLSVTDGEWIIFFGLYGWIGYFLYYGLMIVPIFFAVRASIIYGQYRSEIIFLSLIVMLVLVNTLVNSGIAPWVWLISGALLGVTEKMKKQAVASTDVPTEDTA